MKDIRRVSVYRSTMLSVMVSRMRKTILKNGDIVNIDCTTKYNGYFGDSSRMFMIGDVDPGLEETGRGYKESTGSWSRSM